MRLVWVLMVGLLAVGVVGEPARADLATAARQQLAWLVDASARAPVPAAEQHQHLAPEFLAAIGGPDGFNAVLQQVGPLTLDRVVTDAPTFVAAVTDGRDTTFLTTVTVDGTGLVIILLFAPEPSSWAELDAGLRALAPQVAFASATVDGSGRCQVVHGVSADVARPLGSGFKLWVLDALGRAVADGRAAWDQRLAIRDEWKSVPTGVLQDEPAGTRLPLRRYADLMISISDNTATDHLIRLLGRGTVAGRAPRGNAPFLTTREMSTLKGHRYPTLADAYLALPPPRRAAVLPAIGRIPLSDVEVWAEPRKIDTIEWFGSPLDVCHVYADLWRQSRRSGLAPIGRAMSINDGGIGLDRRLYPTVWFKGGSEPGVLTLNYLVRTSDGRTVVSSFMLADPGRAFDASIKVLALALVRGGIRLV
jgi:hypothetical protein